MKFFTLFLLPILLLSGEMLTRTQAIMGTFVHITLPKENNKEISTSFEQLKGLEDVLSSYAPHLVYQLNQKHTVPYNPTLAHAITLSKDYYNDTNGYFDITIGSISKKLYHFGEENSTIPNTQALHKAQRNIHGIELNTTSIVTKENITLDLGGIGKGYAVDTVVERLGEQGKAFASVSLFCHADNAKIDAYATAISVMPKAKALTFLKKHREIGFVLVLSDGKIVYENLDAFVKMEAMRDLF